MKVFFAALIFTITLFFLPGGEAAASSRGLRQALVERPDIEALYAVDSTHTFVKGTLPALGVLGDFTVVGSYYGAEANMRLGSMIEHDAEPMVYKSKAHGSLLNLSPLRGGKVRLASSPLGSGGGEYSALDIFETAMLSCAARGGHPLYVVPKKYDNFKRLTEVGALEAFEYILAKGAGGTWFVACDGASEVRFQVLKNYDFINDGEELAELREGIVLYDVNYVKDESVERARLAALEMSWPRSRFSLEGTAREIAALKMGYVRNFEGKRNYGSYKGQTDKGRCASVSIKSVAEQESLRVSEVHDYKVCSGKVYALGISEREEKIAGGPGLYIRRGGFKVATNP